MKSELKVGQTLRLNRLIKAVRMEVIIHVMTINKSTTRGFVVYSEDPEIVAGQVDLFTTKWLIDDGSLLS